MSENINSTLDTGRGIETVIGSVDMALALFPVRIFEFRYNNLMGGVGAGGLDIRPYKGECEDCGGERVWGLAG